MHMHELCFGRPSRFYSGESSEVPFERCEPLTGEYGQKTQSTGNPVSVGYIWLLRDILSEVSIFRPREWFQFCLSRISPISRSSPHKWGSHLRKGNSLESLLCPVEVDHLKFLQTLLFLWTQRRTLLTCLSLSISSHLSRMSSRKTHTFAWNSAKWPTRKAKQTLRRSFNGFSIVLISNSASLRRRT